MLPEFAGAELEDQLHIFDVLLCLLSPSARPQIAALLTGAAEQARTPQVRARLADAAEAVSHGGRATRAESAAKPTPDETQGLALLAPHTATAIPDGKTQMLPVFRYHPDPVASGSVMASEQACECCGEARGYVYFGPVYAEDDFDRCICPWCIADGSAHARWGCSFTNPDGIGGGDPAAWPAQAVIDEVTRRTPGFYTWQQEQWWTHCGDAAAFWGTAGRQELVTLGPDAIAAIRASTATQSEDDWQTLFNALDKSGSPTAYVFRCRTCGLWGGYQDGY